MVEITFRGRFDYAIEMLKRCSLLQMNDLKYLKEDKQLVEIFNLLKKFEDIYSYKVDKNQITVMRIKEEFSSLQKKVNKLSQLVSRLYEKATQNNDLERA